MAKEKRQQEMAKRVRVAGGPGRAEARASARANGKRNGLKE